MDEQNWLAKQFDENRDHLRAVAYRMLGSSTEADDAVQESWLRLSRSGATGVQNLGGWLMTIVARVCLDMLRVRKSRREEILGASASAQIAGGVSINPENEALLADSIGPALLIVLETLTPAERVVFVLHDLFAVPFDEVGPIVGRSPAAARQLASRARRQVRGAARVPDAGHTRQQEVVAAFLAASREGNFDALLAVLDPDVVVRADSVAVRMGASAYFQHDLEGGVRGSRAVAETFKGKAEGAQLALVNGEAGAVWARGGGPRVVFAFTITRGKIVQIDLLADPERVRQLDVVVLGG